MPAWLPMVWFQHRHLIKVENGSNFYLHNTDSIFCPLSQEWARTASNYNGKEAVNYPFGISTCFCYLMCSLLHWMSTFWFRQRIEFLFAQRIANFLVCLVLISLLTWILCPLWSSIPIFCIYIWFILFNQMPQNIKVVQWSDRMWLAGIISLLYCDAGALWCYPAHLLRERRSDKGSESKRWGLMS